MKSDYSPTGEVLEIGKLSFKGNVIPERWFQALTYDSGRPHINAIIILSEIVYWYRPTEIRDESTGRLIEIRKKFKADLLQRNYQGFSKKFGFSKKQVQDAFDYLRSIEAIYTELRTIDVGEDLRLPNVMFIGINPAKIRELTFDAPILSGTGSVPIGTDPQLMGADGTTLKSDPPNLKAPYTKTTKKTSTKTSTGIKENDFFQKSASPVETFSSDPIADQISALRAEPSTQETPELHRSSTLAVMEKVPPRENHSQIIKTAADVKPAVTRAKAKKMAELADRKAKQNPDAAEAWWTMFRTQALQADCKPGSKADALASWDLLHEIDPDPATLYERIIHGTELYWERELKRDRPNCKHGVRFLEKRDWQEALDWADIKSQSSSQPAQQFAPFLTCWNQDRPLVWPEADEWDLSPKGVGRLQELIASCDNSLERFQKALQYCKRDPYWGLQRSETLEDFLYSGRINEFYKKQIHAEKIGLDKVAAPDRKAIEAAAKKEASRKESIARLFENFRKGELSKEDFRACLPGYGIDPDSVPEAC